MNYIEKTKDEKHQVEFVWRFNTQQALLIKNALEEAKENYSFKISAMYEGIEDDKNATIQDLTLVDEFNFRKTSVTELLKQLHHALFYKPAICQS